MAENIAYQNKDILFKILSKRYKNKSFSVYGIDIPPIKAMLPTNLPQISANEKSMDNLFLLEDGTYAIVDYESEYKRTNKIKYMNYIARVMEQYLKEDEGFNLRLIVIYTGDVKSAVGTFETNCITLRAEQAFLSLINGRAELDTIRKKFSTGDPLTDSDLMKLVILPLTIQGNEGKHTMLESVVTLAGQLPREQQDFVLSGAIVASDKFIKSDYKEQLRRLLSMTWLSEMYEKEKIEYAEQVAAQVTARVTEQVTARVTEQVTARVTEQVTAQVTAQEKKNAAKALLEDNVDIKTIMRATNLSEKEILELRDESPVTV